MIHENSNEAPDPKKEYIDNDIEKEETEESYDILPSNGPGLAGDDGEQVVDDLEEDYEEETDDKDE